jgi:hypothetical protein
VKISTSLISNYLAPDRCMGPTARRKGIDGNMLSSRHPQIPLTVSFSAI